MANSNFKGLWIPFEILTDTGLSDKEKIIYSIILYLSKDNKYCIASNQYISSIVNVSITQVSKLISSLRNKNYINVDLIYQENSKQVKNRKITPIQENDNRYCSNIKEVSPPKVNAPPHQNNKDIINNKNNIDNNYNSLKQNNNRSKSSYPNYEQRQYSADYLNQFYANVT